jgi:hypothetical protein
MTTSIPAWRRTGGVRLGTSPLLLAAILVLAGPIHPAAAQDAPRITVTRAGLSTDTIALGDRFELEVAVRLTPTSIAFLPDSVLGRGFEPFGAVTWTSTVLGDGGVEVTATYPLIAFGVGTVEVPEFEVYAADAEESARAGMAIRDEPVGSFGTFVDNVEMVPSARLRTVPSQQIWVASVLLLDDQEHAIAPRPPADVAGGDRNWLATVLALVFGTALLGVAAISLRDWAVARNATPATPAPSARANALQALDDLLASELLGTGRTRDFFARSSEIARRYVESFDAQWNPAWTGTELMHGLGKRVSAEPMPAPDPKPLRDEVTAAEAVKFGGVRPDSGASEEHVRRVRDWIAAVPEESE